MVLNAGWIYYFVAGGFGDASGEYALSISLVSSPHAGPYESLPLPGRYAHANTTVASALGNDFTQILHVQGVYDANLPALAVHCCSCFNIVHHHDRLIQQLACPFICQQNHLTLGWQPWLHVIALH